MTEKQDDGYWTEDVKVEYHPPEGTFTKDAKEIVQILMKGAKNDATLALHRLVFYMNRAGDKLTNSGQLNKAKEKLEELIKKGKDKVEK